MPVQKTATIKQEEKRKKKYFVFILDFRSSDHDKKFAQIFSHFNLNRKNKEMFILCIYLINVGGACN